MGDKELQEDKDVEYLRGKARNSVSNVLTRVLEDENVQRTINRTIVRQSIETGFFLSFLIVGVSTLVNGLKEAVNVSWQADMALGFILTFIGAVYTFKKLNT